MEIFIFKAAAVFLIIFGGLAGGLAPLKIGITPRGRRLLSLGNSFAGGVFLGAGLIHMLPDSIEKFDSLAGGSGYPFAALLCGGGFLLVLFLEKTLVGEKALRLISEGRAVYPYILFLVLSVHSIIAGVSLGLEKTLISSSVIFIAIIAHKSSAAFALGVSLRNESFSSRRLAWTVAFFSCMTPLGVILGAAFSNSASNAASVRAEAVFDALAAGTFLYVPAIDIIDEVFETEDDRVKKFLLISAAFGLMCSIAVWA